MTVETMVPLKRNRGFVENNLPLILLSNNRTNDDHKIIIFKSVPYNLSVTFCNVVKCGIRDNRRNNLRVMRPNQSFDKPPITLSYLRAVLL